MKGKARVEFIARITDEDGQVIERTVSAIHDFPCSKDFDLSTKDGFLSDFDAFEQAVLEARDKAGQEVTADFLELASKKTEKPPKRRHR